MISIRGFLSEIAHKLKGKEPSLQDQLGKYYKTHGTYEGFKLPKGKIIVNGCICDDKYNTGAPAKKQGITSVAKSKTQTHGAGANGPSIWDPVKEIQKKGDYAPHQR